MGYLSVYSGDDDARGKTPTFAENSHQMSSAEIGNFRQQNLIKKTMFNNPLHGTSRVNLGSFRC